MLAGEFACGAEGARHEVVEFDIPFLEVHPCIGCGTPEMTRTSRFMNDAYELGRSLS